MSCARKPSALRAPTESLFWWDCDNGSTIWCDHPIVCEATFHADTDIGGWGVSTKTFPVKCRSKGLRLYNVIKVALAFIITAWTTTGIALYGVLIELFNSFDCFKRWSQHFPFSKTFLDSVLDALRDLQLVTGTAIIVAALPQWNTITFYHRQLVMCYWFLTLNSLWAAHTSSINVSEEGTNFWKSCLAWKRKVFTTLSLGLAISWNSHHIISDKVDWDPCVSGKCYRMHDKSSVNTQWLWVAGEALFVGALLIELTLFGTRALRKCGDWLREYEKTVKANWSLEKHSWWTARHDLVHNLLSARLFITLGRLLLASTRVVTFAVYMLVAWCLVQFIAVCSFGNGHPLVEIIFYIGFASWSTWNIVDLKRSNTLLLIDSESTWRFGQVLPLFLLSLLGLQFLNAAVEAYA